ncbi:MAG: hypothetical protein KDJ65_12925 [Anaerolineae bacterium]|nr:hypothetical protein [Anaerolineae bacterium]
MTTIIKNPPNNRTNTFNSTKLYFMNWLSLWQNKRLDFRDILNIFRYCRKWHLSLAKNYWEGPLHDEIPWVTFSAIDFLIKSLNKSDKVFEYGAGGSTLFLAKRVNEVISVDHNPKWNQKVIEKLNEKKLKNVFISCVEGEQPTNNLPPYSSDYQSYYSTSTKLFYYDYVNFINEFPDSYFDWVIIDGRARPACIKHSLRKVKPHKYLLLDNSDRTDYQIAINHLLQGWERITFDGPTPYLIGFTQTSIWKKPL